MDHGKWIKERIRTVPNYPKPGITFRDLTTLWADPASFRRSVDWLVQNYVGVDIDKVVGIESRGFIIGGAMAHQLTCGFVPVRKPGKLPYKTIRKKYSLEYGVDELEIHVDAIRSGDLVLIVDDLLATGGTAAATAELIREAGGIVVAACFIAELTPLKGAERLKKMGVEVVTLCQFEHA